jgi:trigger factor
VFAKSVGQETVEALKGYVKEQLVAKAKEANKRTYERKVLDAAVNVCEVSYPQSIVERDLDSQLHEESHQFKDGVKGMEAYLKSMNKTLDQHREDLRPNTIKRLLDDLVIDKVAEEEKIEVSVEDIDKQIDSIAQSAGDKSGEFRKILDTPEGRHRIEHSVRDRKAVDRLVEIAEGKSPVSA